MNRRNVKSIAYRNHVAGQEIFPQIVPEMSRLRLLGNSNEQEVLEFLKARLVHTVVMASFIRDNGMESADNRGKFYGYRNVSALLSNVEFVNALAVFEGRF